MVSRPSRWGVGPLIAAVAFPYAALAAIATYRWPVFCGIRSVPYSVLAVGGGILVLSGVFLLAVAARSLERAYNSDTLVTSGAFAVVRHPIYSAWIVFIVPGLALLSRSWVLLLTPFLAYAVFKLRIHREDDYLQQRFGKAYLDYRAQVRELIPMLGHWQRPSKHAKPQEEDIMTAQNSSLDRIEDFLAQKRIAMVGISHDRRNFSAVLFQELCHRGYDVVPVNPHLREVMGRKCFASVQDIEPPVDAALLMTSPAVTETVVHDCAEAGIRRIWMHRAGTHGGAVSDSAIQFCRERGIQVIPGECPLMFLPQSGAVHHLHGFFRKLTGRYPKHVHA